MIDGDVLLTQSNKYALEVNGKLINFSIAEWLSSDNRDKYWSDVLLAQKFGCQPGGLEQVALHDVLYYLAGSDIQTLLCIVYRSLTEGGRLEITNPSGEAIASAEQSSDYQTRLYLGVEYPGEILVKGANDLENDRPQQLHHYLDGEVLHRLLVQNKFEAIRLRNEGSVTWAEATK